MASAFEYFEDEDYKEYDKAKANIISLLNETEFSKSEKENYLSTLMNYEKYFLTSERMVTNYNKTLQEAKKLKELYEKEPNDKKAEEYKQEYLKKRETCKLLERRRNYYKAKYKELEPKAIDAKVKINEAINKKKDKRDTDDKAKVPKKRQ